MAAHLSTDQIRNQLMNGSMAPHAVPCWQSLRSAEDVVKLEISSVRGSQFLQSQSEHVGKEKASVDTSPAMVHPGRETDG